MNVYYVPMTLQERMNLNTTSERSPSIQRKLSSLLFLKTESKGIFKAIKVSLSMVPQKEYPSLTMYHLNYMKIWKNENMLKNKGSLYFFFNSRKQNIFLYWTF